MSGNILNKHQNILKAIAVTAAVAFLYATVLAKLGRDWWSDENYSHGVLVPFVIAIIVWKEWNGLKSVAKDPSVWLGSVTIILAFLLLFAGTLGAEFFYLSHIARHDAHRHYRLFIWDKKLNFLAVPFSLLLLAIPIPQIIFNRIAFPLQIWASQMAVWGIRLFEVILLRKTGDGKHLARCLGLADVCCCSRVADKSKSPA
ncbi:MAG: archaeosortase/exosortase family protein [Pyrinomonadaceae bacterium]